MTEEGIEPHPGPARVCSKNIDGLVSRFESALYRIKIDHERSPILAVCLQEHNFTKQKLADSRAVDAAAHKYGLLFICAPMPDDEHKGGTAIIIPHSSIELKKGESLHSAITKIRRSARRLPNGRAVTVTLTHEGHDVSIMSAYAPVTDTDKPAFFTALAPLLSPHTILGIDANCVLDPTVDLHRQGRTQWNDAGSQEYHNALTAVDLTDITRETLGERTPFFTNHTVTDATTGAMTHTRIDHIHTPQIDALQFHLDTRSTDFLKFGRKYGHDMLHVLITPAREERGTDLRTISETIYDSLDNNDQTVQLINQTLGSPQDGEWCDAWEKVKVAVRDLGLEQTRLARQRRSTERQKIITQINIINGEIKDGRANAADHALLRDLENELRQNKKDTSLASTLERDAYDTGQKHDVSSKAFYRQWTPRSSAHWVNEVILRDWADPSNPVPLPPDPSNPRPDKEHPSKRHSPRLHKVL